VRLLLSIQPLLRHFHSSLLLAKLRLIDGLAETRFIVLGFLESSLDFGQLLERALEIVACFLSYDV